jgi:protein-disulfide isomerase
MAHRRSITEGCDQRGAMTSIAREKIMRKLMITFVSALALSACSGGGGDAGNQVSGSAAGNVKAPAGTDWASTVVKTAEGGYQMGNPAAAVKIIEYGALSCPHCAKFSADSAEGLKAYVAKGTVSYEFRSFLIHPQDVPATLLATCNGPGPFFAISEALFANQSGWNGANIKNLTDADQQALQSMSPVQASALVADRLGLIDFVATRGVGKEKAKACLSDSAAIDAIGKMTTEGQKTFEITGTPTFIVNGSVIRDANTWEGLEPYLKKAGA